MPQAPALRILVIDDSEVIRNLFTHLLEYKGYEVLALSSPEEAVRWVEQKAFDVVFLDMVMPTTNGLELFKRLHKTRPSVRVVLMTGYAVEDKMREALSLGAFDYLYKPFDLTDIMAILKKILKQESLKPLGE